jgi:hypothetical protein
MSTSKDNYKELQTLWASAQKVVRKFITEAGMYLMRVQSVKLSTDDKDRTVIVIMFADDELLHQERLYVTAKSKNFVLDTLVPLYQMAGLKKLTSRGQLRRALDKDADTTLRFLVGAKVAIKLEAVVSGDRTFLNMSWINRA